MNKTYPFQSLIDELASFGEKKNSHTADTLV
jgi:hypothetical protein